MPIEYLPLTVSQKWILSEMENFKYPGWVTIEFQARTREPMDEWDMRESAYYLADKYETLRVRFTRMNGQWAQEVYPLSEARPFDDFDLSGEDVSAQLWKIREMCIKERESLLPEKGNLIRICYFKLSEKEGLLWFCLHHAIADYISAVMLGTEFMATYQHIRQGGELKWQTVKDYRKWLYMVEGYCRDILMPAELTYWESLPWEKVSVLPSDYPDRFHHEDIIVDAIRNNTILTSFCDITHGLDRELTLQLFAGFGADFENALTAVFFLAIARRKEMEWLPISVCNSGRSLLPAEYDIDANKLAGYLSTARCLLLRRPYAQDIGADVREVMEQIRDIPNGGMGFPFIRGAIRNEALKKSWFHSVQQGDIFLNYFGRADAKNNSHQFDLVWEDTGHAAHVMELRKVLLECLVAVRENRLFIKLAYNSEYLTTGTIEGILEEMENIFREAAVRKSFEKVA